MNFTLTPTFDQTIYYQTPNQNYYQPSATVPQYLPWQSDQWRPTIRPNSKSNPDQWELTYQNTIMEMKEVQREQMQSQMQREQAQMQMQRESMMQMEQQMQREQAQSQMQTQMQMQRDQSPVKLQGNQKAQLSSSGESFVQGSQGNVQRQMINELRQVQGNLGQGHTLVNFQPPEQLLVNTEDFRDQKLRKYREKREKRKYGRDVNSKRRKLAQTRIRDENGLFIPSKKVRTNTDYLQDRLMNTEDENRKLKEMLEQQQRELAEMKKKLMEQGVQYDGESSSYEQNSTTYEQNSTGESHLSYQEQYYEFKKRSELHKKMESEMTGNPVYRNQVSMLEQNYEKPRYGGPPTLIFNEFPPWHNYSVPAFTEKINFSEVQLRPTGQPPSKVDLARMESLNGQKQMVMSELLRQKQPTNGDNPGYHPNSYFNTNDPVAPKMSKAFAEKVDLVSQRTKLKSTPTKVNSPMSYDDDYDDYENYEDLDQLGPLNLDM